MWAWISAASPGIMIHLEERLTSNVYIRVLEDVMVMLPSVQAVYPNGEFIFQHDHCSVHTAHRVVAGPSRPCVQCVQRTQAPDTKGRREAPLT
jgi:hypothetical protein